MASQMRMLEKAVSHKTFLITCFRLFRAWHSINMHTHTHTQQTRARQIPMNISLIANGLICLSIEWNHYKLETKVHAVCSIFKTSSIFLCPNSRFANGTNAEIQINDYVPCTGIIGIKTFCRNETTKILMRIYRQIHRTTAKKAN